jgi:membrane protease YdiL (CAAX protease family)
MKEHHTPVFLAAITSSILLLGLLLVSYFLRGLGVLSSFINIGIIIFEVTVPFEVLRRYQISAKDYNIYAHKIDTILDLALPPFSPKRIKPDFISLREELWVFLKVSFLVFSAYIFFYWAFGELKAASQNTELLVSLNFPPMVLYEILIQVFVAGIPEEIFYRGFLQSAFLRRWPNRTTIFGLPCGFAILLTNFIFALGHVASTLNPTRMLTFFPGLIFSYFVYKNKSLVAAVLFHASCNILGQILAGSFYLR